MSAYLITYCSVGPIVKSDDHWSARYCRWLPIH